MFSVWTKHTKTEQEKTDYARSLQNSGWILRDLSKILKDMEEDLDRAETNPKNYEVPNWAYRQAHNNGYRQALNIVNKIINLDQKETDDRQSIIARTRPTAGQPELL